ncbi:unnamed protein product [Chrysoparadoxa australica]
MCIWNCLSEGPNTNLKCLHCGIRYCGACLHGEGGKMESLIKCAGCGGKPRTMSNKKRGSWKGAPFQGGEQAPLEGSTPFGRGTTGPRGSFSHDLSHALTKHKAGSYNKPLHNPSDSRRGSDAARRGSMDSMRRGSTSSIGRPVSRRASNASATDAAAAAAGGEGGGRRRSSIFDRLTDPSQYNGTHKHRFDESGKGLGLAGRDSVSKGKGHNAGPNALSIFRAAEHRRRSSGPSFRT